MTEREEFITWLRSALRDAEVAVHNGDVGPRRAIWSRNDPVTVLGAWKNASGQQELDELFAHLANSFSDCTSYEFELLEAEVRGDTAYTVGIEHTSASVRVPTPSARRRSTGVRTARGRSRTGMGAHRQNRSLKSPLEQSARQSSKEGAVCVTPPRTVPGRRARVLPCRGRRAVRPGRRKNPVISCPGHSGGAHTRCKRRTWGSASSSPRAWSPDS
jgi:hypothetical protein